MNFGILLYEKCISADITKVALKTLHVNCCEKPALPWNGVHVKTNFFVVGGSKITHNLPVCFKFKIKDQNHKIKDMQTV